MDLSRYAILGMDGISKIGLDYQYEFYTKKNGDIEFRMIRRNDDIKLEDGNTYDIEYVDAAKYQFNSSDLNRDVCVKVEDDIPLIEYLSSYTIKEEM